MIKKNQKKIIGILITILGINLISSCSVEAANKYTNRKYSEWGTNYFDKATIDIHTEVITVDVAWWYDYENNETIVIGTTDGKIYYTHNRDCTLICTESQVR